MTKYLIKFNNGYEVTKEFENECDANNWSESMCMSYPTEYYEWEVEETEC